MRQLKLTPIKDRLTPTEFAVYKAEQAEALPLLRNLSVTHPLPLDLDAEREETLLRFIVSIATQHRNQGASWAELLTAGHASLAECLVHYAERPDKFDKWVAFMIRQGIFGALPKKERLE